LAHGDFVWSDLSAYRPDTAIAFYRSVFGWDFVETAGTDNVPYHIAKMADRECAGLFEMPRMFQEMKLPSFWMSYIQVDEFDTAVDTAGSSGGKIELGPVEFDSASKIALIRDPLGAGFTVYEGSGLTPRPTSPKPGEMAWNALHVSKAEMAIPFYRALFGWSIVEDDKIEGQHHVIGANGAPISEIRERGTEDRGGFEYWAVTFAVEDLSDACVRARQAGGEVGLSMDGLSITPIYDPDGACFYIVAVT